MRFTRPSKDLLALLLVLGVATCLRFKDLTFQSYWNDELHSAFVSDPRRDVTDVYRLTVGDVAPPLYQILLWGWFRTFGYSEYAGRSLSAVAGVLGVLAAYLLGRQLAGSRVGHTAAWIAASNHFLIYFSQESRCYALLFLGSTLSLLFFVRTLERASVANAAGYVTATALTLYTHYFGIVLCLAQGGALAFHLIKTPEHRRTLTFAALASATALAVLATPLIGHIHRLSKIPSWWMPTPPPWFLGTYGYHYVESPWLLAVFALLLVLCLKRLTSDDDPTTRRWITLLLVFTALSYAVPYVRGLIAAPVLSIRNSMIAVPALVALSALGIDAVERAFLRRLVAVTVVVLSLGHLFLGGYYTKVTKSQIRQVAAAIADSEVPAYSPGFSPQKFNVYLRWMGSAVRVRHLSLLTQELERERAPRSFWLMGPGIDEVARVIREYGLLEVRRVEKTGARAALFRTPP